jgi:tRNA threonylcarbamoyladenosine biosynthesis protein TsaB
MATMIACRSRAIAQTSRRYTGPMRLSGDACVASFAMPTLIAFDTSTERMTVALRHGDRVVAREGEGGARASATLLPAVLGVLAEAGIALADLDAIAFGRGPGAFTGLRTACAVAQGLALGATKRVLPIDTLLAVAEDARRGAPTSASGRSSTRAWTRSTPPSTRMRTAAGRRSSRRSSPIAKRSRRAGKARRRRSSPATRSPRSALACAPAMRRPLPTPRRERPRCFASPSRRGATAPPVDPALALPLYVRDKVAETESERAARRAVVSS